MKFYVNAPDSGNKISSTTVQCVINLENYSSIDVAEEGNGS